MIVYHCSNVRIDKFNFSEGVHFGGIRSALEAGLRKDPDGGLFLHRCNLYITDAELKVEDLGNKEAWDEEFHEMKNWSWKYAKYRNKYEPDNVPSYFVIDSSCITLLGVECIDSVDAEEFVCEERY